MITAFVVVCLVLYICFALLCCLKFGSWCFICFGLLFVVALGWCLFVLFVGYLLNYVWVLCLI